MYLSVMPVKTASPTRSGWKNCCRNMVSTPGATSEASSRRTSASADLVADVCANLVALDALIATDPLDPRTHIALHGAYRGAMQSLQGDGFARLVASATGDERHRWERDEKLLTIASKAREARFGAARAALGLAVD